jgi:hypothetical protein
VEQTVQPPGWPADPGHRDALETVLAMAAAEQRWGENHQALRLLDSVERSLGDLPQRYRSVQTRARSAAITTPGA